MKYQAGQLSRYHCVICGKKLCNAHQAYIREDRPYGPRLCREHAQIVGEHFADVMITTLKLALVRKRLRQAGYQVDAVECSQKKQYYSMEDSDNILSQLLD